MAARIVLFCLAIVFMATCKGRREDGSNMNENTNSKMKITEEEARKIAEEDAKVAYRDLSIYRVECKLEGQEWHVDYELKDENSLGGGPHYVIDGESGEIVRKRYEQ
jgi:hypothetical protein